MGGVTHAHLGLFAIHFCYPAFMLAGDMSLVGVACPALFLRYDEEQL